MTTTALHTRWMICRDMPGVLAVEAAAGGDWGRETFLDALRQRNVIGHGC